MLPASGWGLCPQAPALALRYYGISDCALDYNWRISYDIKKKIE